MFEKIAQEKTNNYRESWEKSLRQEIADIANREEEKRRIKEPYNPDFTDFDAGNLTIQDLEIYEKFKYGILEKEHFYQWQNSVEKEFSEKIANLKDEKSFLQNSDSTRYRFAASLRNEMVIPSGIINFETKLGRRVEKNFRYQIINSPEFSKIFSGIFEASKKCDDDCKVDYFVKLPNGRMLGIQVTINPKHGAPEKKIYELKIQPLINMHDANGKVMKNNLNIPKIPKVVVFLSEKTHYKAEPEKVFQHIVDSLYFEYKSTGDPGDQNLFKDYLKFFEKETGTVPLIKI